MKKLLLLPLCALALLLVAAKVSTYVGVTVANDADTMYVIQGGASKKIAAAHFRSNATHYGTTVLKGPVRRITANIPTILNQPGVDLQDSHNSGESAWAVGSFIGGGSRNRVGTNNDQTVSGDGAILTGTANVIMSGAGSDNAIGGGGNNKIETLTSDPGDFSTDSGIFSGLNNIITSSDASFIGGGDGNSINGFGNVIGGGAGNAIAGISYASILGGRANGPNANGQQLVGNFLSGSGWPAYSSLFGFGTAAQLAISTNGGGGGYVEVAAGIFFAKGGSSDAGIPSAVFVDNGTGGASLILSNSAVVANVLEVDGLDGAVTSASLAGGGEKVLLAPSTGKITGATTAEFVSGALFTRGSLWTFGNTDTPKPALMAVDDGGGGPSLILSNSLVVANVLEVDGLDGGITSASLAGGTGNKLLMAPSTGKVTSTGLNYFTGSATLDFASTSAQTSTDLTITVTGAASGDVVSIGVPNGSILANSSFSGWVSAANTVTVRFNNHSSTSKDPASGTFSVTVIHF